VCCCFQEDDEEEEAEAEESDKSKSEIHDDEEDEEDVRLMLPLTDIYFFALHVLGCQEFALFRLGLLSMWW